MKCQTILTRFQGATFKKQTLNKQHKAACVNGAGRLKKQQNDQKTFFPRWFYNFEYDFSSGKLRVSRSKRGRRQ
jgi:hypothetical protein